MCHYLAIMMLSTFMKKVGESLESFRSFGVNMNIRNASEPVVAGSPLRDASGVNASSELRGKN